MDYKKPQSTLVQGGAGIYPLTTADQVILADGSRLEKDGQVHADVLGGKSLAEIMLTLYPVGAVYISVNSTSPASLFGGTWEQIMGRFLIGTGAPEPNDDGTSPGSYNYAAGRKGGEATHTLTVDEMPRHSHLLYFGGGPEEEPVSAITWSSYDTWQKFGGAIESTGGNQPHTNIPPYLAVYMWKRVS